MEWVGGKVATDMTDKWQGLGPLELQETWAFVREENKNKNKAGAAGTLAENHEMLELA